jgi:hypothetical protein
MNEYFEYFFGESGYMGEEMYGYANGRSIELWMGWRLLGLTKV